VFTRTHYVSLESEYIPLAISYIDDTDGNYTKMVEHQHWILLLSQAAPQLSFDLSLVFRKVIDFIVPGPGYTITLPPGASRLVLFDMNCRFMNSYLTSETLLCYYFDTAVGEFTFYKEALIATGIRGRMWLVEYAYIRDRCGLVCYREVLDSSLAVYMVPYFRSTNRIDYSVYIDENPYDGLGWLNRVFNFLFYDSNTTLRLLGEYPGEGLSIGSEELTAKSGSTPLFGIAVPVGAILRALAGSLSGWPGILISTLSVGFSASGSSTRFYVSLTEMSYDAITDMCFYPYYIELTAFLVKDAKDYYKTPFMVVSPNIIAPSCPRPPPDPYATN
jgi:hypothetical protein